MKRTFLLSLLASIILMAACNKKDEGSTVLKINMTDAPVNAEEVNIDLQAVRVNFTADSSGWTDLDAIPGIYNLLGLQNGLDTLIAQGTVPAGMLKEIRLVLGSNNTIKVNGQVYPLIIPSGSESGLKIKVNKKLAAPMDSLLVDFDAALSVHQEGTGDYKLRPVLKLK
ncbi:MAG TPA: DUF4382 domain-containing protein [Chitinophagaceae bacterium]|nr:DUF4382 domain-containing protein [Chitinophagaceae bacterium]